jgi:hypothetical protein
MLLFLFTQHAEINHSRAVVQLLDSVNEEAVRIRSTPNGSVQSRLVAVLLSMESTLTLFQSKFVNFVSIELNFIC